MFEWDIEWDVEWNVEWDPCQSLLRSNAEVLTLLNLSKESTPDSFIFVFSFTLFYPSFSILYPLFSILYSLSFILYHLSSILYPSSFILYPLSSILSVTVKKPSFIHTTSDLHHGHQHRQIQLQLHQ